MIAEDRQAKVCKHARLSDERNGTERLLHGDLGDRGQVQVSVVRHHDTTEQDCHDAYNTVVICIKQASSYTRMKHVLATVYSCMVTGDKVE